MRPIKIVASRRRGIGAVGFALGASMTVGMVFGLTARPAAAAERSYVVSMLVAAAAVEENACPKGLNPDAETFFHRDLAAAGESPENINKILTALREDQTGPAGLAASDAITFRGRTDGKPTNVYAYPGSVPDAHIKTVEGKFAYGFNLDGKGAGDSGTFEDPETHEQGIDNQFFRAMGCHQGERPNQANPNDTFWGYVWRNTRLAVPAWIITLRGDDLTKDGPVTVIFDKAMDHMADDANGNTLADKTFRLDPDPRWHNEFPAEIKNGAVTSVAPANFHMLYDTYWIPVFDMANARIRLKFKPDGSLVAILGGYEKWRSLYFAYASFGSSAETTAGYDLPGTYYALKQLADAEPDPKTGENTRISAAFRLEAVPAFAVPLDSNKVLASNAKVELSDSKAQAANVSKKSLQFVGAP